MIVDMAEMSGQLSESGNGTISLEIVLRKIFLSAPDFNRSNTSCSDNHIGSWVRGYCRASIKNIHIAPLEMACILRRSEMK